MRFLQATLRAAAAACFIATAHACQNCTNESQEPYELIPAPWTLKGTIYSITLLPVLETLGLGGLPAKAYPPLERQYQSATEGQYKGILGMIQIIRYTESPVGPYDELLIVPGFFAYNRTEADGTTREKLNVRVSRIYVSQKYTAWNGRQNWHIPKHLAKFDWTDHPDGSTSVKVYPFDTTGDSREAYPAPKPWFQTTFTQGLLSTLDIPFSTDVYKLAGINATLAQPPLPQGRDAFGMLVGTEGWVASQPGQFSDKTSFGVFDLAQNGGDAGADGKNAVGDEYFENFWPGLGRLNVGLKMEDATITFGAPEHWNR